MTPVAEIRAVADRLRRQAARITDIRRRLAEGAFVDTQVSLAAAAIVTEQAAARLEAAAFAITIRRQLPDREFGIRVITPVKEVAR